MRSFLMMNNDFSEQYGRTSSQNRSKESPQIRIWSKPISGPKEQMEILEKVKTIQQFGMRHRGLFEFYGDDLITYKREKPKSSDRNKFLKVLSTYFTDYLEDDCPNTWQECQSSFWEEFLIIFYPTQIILTPNEKEVETFLFELKKFTRWLDRKTGCSSHVMINHLIEESKADLKKCEHLINELFKHAYPDIFKNKGHLEPSDLPKLLDIPKYDNMKTVIFEIKEINNELFIMTDILQNIDYLLNGLPQQIISPDLLIHGIIGRNNGDFVWTWLSPANVMPLRAKKMILGEG